MARLTFVGSIAAVTDGVAAALVSGATATRAAVDARIDSRTQAAVSSAVASSQAVKDAAVSAMQDASVQARLGWVKPSLANGIDLAGLGAGVWPINSAGAAGTMTHPSGALPDPAPGAIEVLTIASTKVVRWSPAVPPAAGLAPRVWQTEYDSPAGTWSPWHRVGGSSGGQLGTRHLDTVIVPGQYGQNLNANATTANGYPFQAAGTLTVKTLGAGALEATTLTQEYEGAHNVAYGQYTARRTCWNGVWGPWIVYAPATEAARVAAGMLPPAAGTRLVPLSVTLPGSTATQAKAEGAVRWVRRMPNRPARARIHISNRNPANNADSGAVTLSSVAVGVGDAAGGVTSPVTVASSGTVPAGGGEWVSPWFAPPGTDGDYLAVTVGWTGGTEQQIMQGGGWTHTAASAASQASVSGWTRSQTTPFYVWVEMDLPSRVPVLAVVGDSLSLGTATTDPVGDGWAAQASTSERFAPVMYAQHGSSMASWGDSSVRWAAMYPGIPFQADAVVMALGQNDLSVGQTLDVLKSRYAEVLKAIRSRFAGAPVHVASVTPSNKAPAEEQTRRAFNAWTRLLSSGERSYVDFVPAISTDDEDMAASLSADSLHPNTAGQAAMAGVVTAARLVPYAVPESEVRATRDTGWRSVTLPTSGSVLETGQTGTIKLRRQGSLVRCQLVDVAITAGTMTGFILPNGLAPGYRFAGLARLHDVGALSNTPGQPIVSTYHRVAVTDNDLWYGGYVASQGAAPSAVPSTEQRKIRGEISWHTEDPWPAI